MLEAVLIHEFAADPWYNMAVDEYLLHVAGRSEAALFIRLYTWQPGAITLGYNQTLERAVDLAAVGRTPLIRRVTGGRALYHDSSELTYAVAFSQSRELVDRLGGSIAVTQARLADVLAEFLRAEGISTNFSRTESAGEHDRGFIQTAPCFASAGRYELMSAAGKVAASAQRRLEGAVLQHGAIKVAGLVSHPALPMVAEGSRAELPSAMKDNSFRRRCRLFADAFARVTGIPVRPRDLSGDDAEAIADWVAVVRKNPLERRDIFKHSPSHLSLS
jgi:lipoate-protein ligase A